MPFRLLEDEENKNQNYVDEQYNQDNSIDTPSEGQTSGFRPFTNTNGNPIIDKLNDPNTSDEQKSAIFDVIKGEAQDQQKRSSDVLSVLGNLGGKFLGGLTEVAKGAGKGALNTIKGLSNIGEQGLSYATGGGKLQKKSFDEVQSLAENKLNVDQGSLTTPTNTAQKVGFTGEQLGEFLIPGGAATKAGKALSGVKALEGAGKVAKVGRGIAKLAPEAIVGAGQQSVQEGDTRDFVKNALLFGVLSKGGELVGKAGKYAAEKLPGKLVDSAIKPSLQETKKAILYGGKTLGQEIVDRGIAGSDKKLLKTATKGIEDNENKLQSILANSKQTISRDEISRYLEPLVEKYSKTPGLEKRFDTLTRIINELPENMPVAEGNVYKRNLYNALTDTAFKVDPSLSAEKEVMKAVAKGLKSEIEKKTAQEAGEGVVKKINEELSVHGRLQDRVLDKLAKSERKNIIGLGDVITGGAGAAVGGIPGLVASTAVNRLTGSTFFKTHGAVLLNKIGKNIDKLPIDKAGKISKAALLKLFDSALASASN